MATNNLLPNSTTSSVILPATGTITEVNAGVSFGIYSDSSSPLYSVDFLSGAADQVTYTYKKLGGAILDIELKADNVYACYEEAVLEYSYLVNIHQAKNALSSLLGSTTGTFDQDGILKSGSLSSSLGNTHLSLKYPKFDYSYIKRVSQGISTEAGIGGNITIYSASFTVTDGIQDYDLQAILSQSSDTDTAVNYYGLIDNKKVVIKKVYYKTPGSLWKFYGQQGSVNVLGNMTSYGQYADDSTFELVPVWQNRLQSMAYEDSMYVRSSHYSYEIINNKLRIFPPPVSGVSPSKMWIQFFIPTDSWVEETNKEIGINGINNLNTLPFGNIPYTSINSIGKHWIRRFALACAKGILGQIRSKFSTIPIPGQDITLNGSALIDQSEKEKEELRTELKQILDELTYPKLAESESSLLEQTEQLLQKIPNLIYVG